MTSQGGLLGKQVEVWAGGSLGGVQMGGSLCHYSLGLGAGEALQPVQTHSRVWASPLHRPAAGLWTCPETT